MAGVPGFEPGNAVSKTGALPLGDTPSVQRFLVMVREARLELAHLAAPEPKSVRLPISPLPQKRWWLRRDSNCDPIIMSDVL